MLNEFDIWTYVLWYRCYKKENETLHRHVLTGGRTYILSARHLADIQGTEYWFWLQVSPVGIPAAQSIIRDWANSSGHINWNDKWFVSTMEYYFAVVGKDMGTDTIYLYISNVTTHEPRMILDYFKAYQCCGFTR